MAIGPSATLASDYITRFAAQDRFVELLARYEGTWMRFSEHLAAADLRRNEWYDEFVLKSGVGDVVAAQISVTESHRVVFGVHEGVGEAPLPPSEPQAS